jgi:hypothetical protein
VADIRHFEVEASLRDVAAAVEAFFLAKSFETHWYEQGDGFLVSAKQMDTVRTLAGQGREATVSIQPSKPGFIVTVDKGGVTSQAIGGALGYVIAGPIGLSAAAYGAYRRHQLANEIFETIETELLLSEGPSTPIDDTDEPGEETVEVD